tara:strand:+ start:3745 stop:5259 length:1515 start_codon:yes stop_codon:yes gene_type:complete
MAKQLVHFGLNYAGSLGLNKQESDDSLDPRWASTATNFVFDQNGRLAARKGTRNVNATVVTNTPTIKSMHEYSDANASKLLIFAADNKLYKLVGDTATDISGSITTPTGDNWQFTNFNDWCVGFQIGHDPIVLTTTGGTFADSGGTQYSGAMVCAAGGRIWTATASVLYYSDLLINNFAGGSAGFFDLASYWKDGMDEVVAISEFNGGIAVFGKNNIIIYDSVLSTAAMIENITGIGCVARDSIQQVGNDLIFLSSGGLIALSRVIQEKSLPDRDVSKNIRDYLLGYVSYPDGDNVKSSYNKKEGFYLLSFPTSNKVFQFNVRAALPDGTFRVTEWQRTFTSLLSTVDDTLYMGLETGYIQTYQGFLDNVASDGTGGSGYTIDYDGLWNDFGQEVSNYEKMLKRNALHIYGGFGYVVTLKWKFDYESDTVYTKSLTTEDGTWFDFGVAEFGISEFGTGSSNRVVKTPLKGSGRVVQMGLTTTTTGSEFGLQRIDIQAKIGKLQI